MQKSILWVTAIAAVIGIASAANGLGTKDLYQRAQQGSHLAICPAYITAGATAAPTAAVIGQRPVPLHVMAVMAQTKLVAAQQVHWTSSNRAIATVDSLGRVTGVSVGDVVIHAQSYQGNAYYCLVVVAAVPGTVGDLKVSP